MSLDYNLGKIENYKTVCWGEDDYMRPVAESIIFASMSTNISPITVGNAADFYARYQMFNTVFGFKDFLTFADVAAHVGLETNVGNMDYDTWLTERYAVFLERKADDDRRAARHQASLVADES